jgi:hypothetical protein
MQYGAGFKASQKSLMVSHELYSMLSCDNFCQAAAAAAQGTVKILLILFLVGPLPSDHVCCCCCCCCRRSDGHLVPVIIELAHSTKQPIETYTSNDPPAVWQVRVEFQAAGFRL